MSDRIPNYCDHFVFISYRTKGDSANFQCKNLDLKLIKKNNM